MDTKSRRTTLLYTPDLEERVEAWVKAKIEPNRLDHVAGVVESADALARRFARDEVMRARLAGWIHDVAKHWSDGELLDYAEAHNLPITPGDQHTPMLLHGLVGYALAADVFGFDDPDLECACALHTTGAPGMDTLAKILFVADLIEPTRDFPSVDELRADAENHLDTALLRGVDRTIQYLIERQKHIDPRALLLRNELIDAGVRYR